MSLLDKLKKSSTVKESSSLETSTFLDVPYTVQTQIPALNIALGGCIEGGMEPGLLQIVGESRNFKTNYALVIAGAFLDKFDDGIVLFYDSEFGASKKYFEAAGVDPSRVLHTPVMNIEELKFDLVKQLEGLTKKDNVFILIDSIGNLASKKESEDAQDQKSVADMSRAKALKSLWRIVTPYLTMKAIPMVAINHVYQEQKLYGKTIVSGGQGNMLSSNAIFIVTRSQEKGDDGIEGWTFNITIEKSRRVKEKVRIGITVMFDGGIQRESGLIDLALELKFIVKPNNGWYSRVDIETGEVEDKKYRAKELNMKWFESILQNDKFKEAVREKYQLSNGSLIADDETVINDSEGEYDE